MALGNWMRLQRRYWWAGLAVLLLAAAAACGSATATPPPDAETILNGAASTTVPVVTTEPTATSPPETTSAETQGPPTSAASPALPDDPTELMRATIGGNVAAIARKMVDSGNQSYIPVLLEFMRFQTGGEPVFTMASFINKLLEGPETVIIPPERTSWDWWIEWLGENPQIQPPEGFAGWKGDLYSLIDPGLGEFLYDGVTTTINLQEVVWGGVGKDGIPELNNPPVIPASEATYLQPGDRVFGVSLNGEHRAYPLRVLNPHEMANDVLGGVHFALAY